MQANFKKKSLVRSLLKCKSTSGLVSDPCHKHGLSLLTACEVEHALCFSTQYKANMW